ncbi:MAG TPA: glycosyltransferase [Opitutaceae bacterium]|nr:glycosyltransferase [Opitutaceae bacterium]
MTLPAPPLVTVFVACYNHARFVVQALESVRMQGYPNVQLIVADDCSKDDSVRVIRAWLDAHWPEALFLVHAENRGVCRTFNEIIGHAKGKYVAGFSADDVWLPERLRAQVEFMESQPEDVGVLYGDAYQIDENGARLPLRFNAAHRNLPVLPDGWVFDTLIEENFVPAMTTLVRRRCYEVVGGYDESLAFEDWDMWLRMSRSFQFRVWPHLSAEYRILSTSMTRSRSVVVNRSAERVLLKCLQQGWLKGRMLGVARRIEHDYARESYREKNPGRFRDAWNCFRRHPSPKNLVLLACCFSGVPADWYFGMVKTARKLKGSARA